MPHKVLIVDDSHITRAMISAAISEVDDLDIIESQNGFEALKLLPLHSFDLILTDINMPEINGLELVGFVKKNPAYSHIPLIIISTEGSEKDREKGLLLGADEYIVKPVDPDQLKKVVSKFLSKR